MRLIDADALIKAITAHCRSEAECLNHFWYDENIVALIDTAPTVELEFPTIKANITEETKQKLIEELQKPHKLLVLPKPEIAFERPQGKWIFNKEMSTTCPLWNCSVCNRLNGNDSFNFCPDCGAKMKGGED